MLCQRAKPNELRFSLLCSQLESLARHLSPNGAAATQLGVNPQTHMAASTPPPHGLLMREHEIDVCMVYSFVNQHINRLWCKFSIESKICTKCFGIPNFIGVIA